MPRCEGRQFLGTRREVREPRGAYPGCFVRTHCTARWLFSAALTGSRSRPRSVQRGGAVHLGGTSCRVHRRARTRTRIMSERATTGEVGADAGASAGAGLVPLLCHILCARPEPPPGSAWARPLAGDGAEGSVCGLVHSTEWSIKQNEAVRSRAGCAQWGPCARTARCARRTAAAASAADDIAAWGSG